MRREIKLIILVFVLVVGPAVAVSFLAARVLGSWQIVLQKRMETDAVRMLDQAMAVWEREKAEVRDLITGGDEQVVLSRRMASLVLAHPWIEGVFIFEPGVGFRYPPVDSVATILKEPGVRQGMPVNIPATSQDCKRMLDQPGLEPAARDAVLLRLAGVCRAGGETNQAMEYIKLVASLQPSLSQAKALSPATRDPDEGFFYDLIALKKLSEWDGTLGSLEFRRELRNRVLARYDDLVPLQREAMVEWLEAGGQKTDTNSLSDAEWRERIRGREWNEGRRQQWVRDMESVIPSIHEDSWVRVKTTGQDLLACRILMMADSSPGMAEARHESAPSILALQIDEQRLARYLDDHFTGVATNTGIRIECQTARQQAGSQPEGMDSKTQVPGNPDATALDRLPVLRLAVLRFPAPLETMALAAYPADARAFLANARLQSRLYRWGGLLLMISAVAGAWLIWRQATTEIRSARERSDFAAAVSHDLRTPLASMRMLAESLYMGNVGDESKKQKFLGAIIKESDRLSRLTDRALYFIRYGQGALRYRFTEGDLGVLVKNVVEVFSIGTGCEVHQRVEGIGPGGAAPAAISLDISPGLPPVRFDGGAMEQVIFNLLDNAVKYSEKGKGAVIDVSLELCDASLRHRSVQMKKSLPWQVKFKGPVVVLSVTDHGMGMPPADVRRILKPYTRGRDAAKRNARGVGLGLALCHHVVKAHGGRIQIESVPGQGSSFRVVLPVG